MGDSTRRKRSLKLAAMAAVMSAWAIAPGEARGQSAVPAATDTGLLDAVNGFVDRLDRVFDYQLAPDFNGVDLYGKRITLGEYANRIVVLSFIDQKNEDEARAWLSDQSLDYMGDQDIVFVNVLYPGRIPFVVSKSNAVDGIRREVDRFLEDLWQKLSAEERDLFQKTAIRWIVDWKRDLQRAYNATRDRVNIAIIDGQGRIRQLIRSKTPQTVNDLKATIAQLKSEKGTAQGMLVK